MGSLSAPIWAVWRSCVLFPLFAVCLPAGAATVRVTSLSDAGVGSLRAGLETLNAQGGQGELDLRELSGTIALASPLPVIMFHGRLLGPADGNLSLNGQGQWPLLSFAAGTTSEVHRLILTNALATGYRHGAAISNAGSLVIDSCTLTGNSNHHGWGGAIFNQGDLRMLNSLVAHNSAEGEPTPGAKLVTPVDRVAGLGGAVFHDAGTWFGSNCTFRANTVIGGSGGSGISASALALRASASASLSGCLVLRTMVLPLRTTERTWRSLSSGDVPSGTSMITIPWVTFASDLSEVAGTGSSPAA